MANCQARGYIDYQVKGQDFGQVDGHVKHKLNGWANSMDVRARVYLPTLPSPHQKVTYICICSTKIVKVLATNVSELSTNQLQDNQLDY